MKKLKLLSFLLAMVMTLSFALTACNKKTSESEKESVPASESVSASDSENDSTSTGTPAESEPGESASESESESASESASESESESASESESESESVVESVPNPKVEAPADDPNYVRAPDDSVYTYNTYTSISPSNWNELTYQDNNDTQIMGYIASNLFEFDFAFDSNGEIIPGEFETEFSFATALEDVSADYGYKVGSGYAWKITIREDGRWDDGSYITAYDFEYTMKEQLNPLFLNYRADSFYNGSTVLVNAESYVFQGSTKFVGAHTKFETWEEAKADPAVKFDILSNATYFGAWANSSYPSYYDYAGEGTGWAWLVYGLGAETTPNAVLALQGKTWAEIEADADLKAAWDATIAMWQTDPNEELHFFGLDYTYPAVAWEDVGFKATSDYTIELHLAKPLQLLNSDGSLSYKAAYNMASLPLVNPVKYEACKQEPQEGSTLWTSNYNSDAATTSSWGPYKLTEFQAGKIYKLEKNPYWYGWNMDKYDGLYETTHVVCETIQEWNTAWLMFKQGGLNGIGIDVSIADEYKNSDQAYFTPDDFVSSLQLQSSKEALAEREEEGVNKTILSYTEFRKALSLGLDRDKYAKATTTSSLAGFGLFNSMHYYDVANGKVYRESDAAKLVLCKTYGVNPEDYPSLDAAVDAITGYNLAQARALVTSAYEAALAAGDINETDIVVLTYGTSTDNEAARRYYDNLSAMWTELMVGTPLEGRFELEFNASFGTKWADDFRAGAYDVCQGGWTGAAWDPGYLLMAYLDAENYAYSAAWDTTAEIMEFTIYGVDENGEATNDANDSFTAELDLMTWWNLLNNDWQSGILNEEFRLELIAALEGVVLDHYYSVPVMYSFSASLISFKTDYITYEYNTFMGYGGIKYMTYNYDDTEWEAFVAENAVNGELNYR